MASMKKEFSIKDYKIALWLITVAFIGMTVWALWSASSPIKKITQNRYCSFTELGDLDGAVCSDNTLWIVDQVEVEVVTNNE